MFGIGMQEILVVLVIALVVIGPKKLPEIAKALGKGYGEFRRAFEDMKNTINVDINMEEEQERLRKIRRSVEHPEEEKSAPESLTDPAGPAAAAAPDESVPPAQPPEENPYRSGKQENEVGGD